MRKLFFLALLFLGVSLNAQQSDFAHIDFSKADNVAGRLKRKKLKVNQLAFELTNGLETDVEKFRAIYMWITHNVANDHRLFLKNNKKRKKYFGDSIKLESWNSKFKKIVFKKLLKRKKTICSGYAYLLQEMCEVAGIKVRTIHGFGKTSDIDLEKLLFANHSWSAVRLNKKWYLCDPTWAAGITIPEKKGFEFKYNDGYFLTDPRLFVMNHFPIEIQWTLLGNKSPSFEEFSNAPLLYGEAYRLFSEHISPKIMSDTVRQKDIVEFKYRLKEANYTQRFHFVFVNGSNEKVFKPEANVKGDVMTLRQEFKRRGFYDVHLYFDKEILATYTFRVTK